jgi:hypothetical protein
LVFPQPKLATFLWILETARIAPYVSAKMPSTEEFGITAFCVFSVVNSFGYTLSGGFPFP